MNDKLNDKINNIRFNVIPDQTFLKQNRIQGQITHETSHKNTYHQQFGSFNDKFNQFRFDIMPQKSRAHDSRFEITNTRDRDESKMTNIENINRGKINFQSNNRITTDKLNVLDDRGASLKPDWNIGLFIDSKNKK
jgi:hypothetical protein